MKPRTTILAGALCAVILLSFTAIASAQQADDAVFRAMQDELTRSVESLRLEEASPPYFLSYTMSDVTTHSVDARYGALVDTEDSQTRNLYVECRVGDHALDSGNFVGTWQDLRNMREDTIEENDYGALRHALWLATDAAYKNAVENLARKTAYLQAHPPKEEIPDFSETEALVLDEAPVDVAYDLLRWKDDVRAASDVLYEFPDLQDWRVSFRTRTVVRRYLNSEGSRTSKSVSHADLDVTATILAPDGQRLTSNIAFSGRDGDLPPHGEELHKAVRKMAADLVAMAGAETLDEYAGPVLFTGRAAAQFISQMFVQQLSPTRTPLVAEEWMKDQIPAPKLAGRLNRRVLPETISAYDRPLSVEWQGRKLTGHRIIDDEAVRSVDLELVKDGRLTMLPMGRQPTKKLRESNGHGLTLPNQWTVPVATSIFIETKKPKKDMVDALRKLCKEFDNEFGLLVELLEEPDAVRRYAWTSDGDTSPGLLTAPLVAYKVYADDGRLEPVRGLVFDEVSIRTLRDIDSMGDTPRLTNLWQPIARMGFIYPASIVTPDILLEEMECKANTEHEPLPVGSRPVAER